MSGQVTDYNNINLSGDLGANVSLFKDIFKKDAVLRVKKIRVRGINNIDCALIYMDGMVDSEQLNDAVIKPLLVSAPPNDGLSITEYISTQVLFARDVKTASDVGKILSGILYGEALLLIDKSSVALMVDTKGWRTRGISEPSDERVLRGPREGFEEAALLNLAMLRRKLQTPDLCTEMLRVGRRSSTLVFICYLGTLANAEAVAEIKRRISKIDIDGILDSNYIAEQIKDKKYSIFKTCGTTERPDVAAARLLEGRIAVVVDGTPVVLTLPYLFSECFQSDEDYYISFTLAAIGRILRFICFILSVSVPAIFIALSSFHKELLPTSLAISVAKLRGGVPVSPLLECLIIIFVFEILKETGKRTPQSLGSALSIVGGLVVGQAAVDARIISTPMLIVVALSGISGLMIPRLQAAVFYLRLCFLFAAAFFGLYGIMSVAFIALGHILSLTSITTDYTVSLKSPDFQGIKDTILRAPWFLMQKRPLFNRNIIRQKGDNE